MRGRSVTLVVCAVVAIATVVVACAELPPTPPGSPPTEAIDHDTEPLPRERRSRLYDPRSEFPRDSGTD